MQGCPRPGQPKPRGSLGYRASPRGAASLWEQALVRPLAPRPLPLLPACPAPSDAGNVTANNLDFNQEITHPLPAPLLGSPRRKPRPEHPGPAGGRTTPPPPPSNIPGRCRPPPPPHPLRPGQALACMQPWTRCTPLAGGTHTSAWVPWPPSHGLLRSPWDTGGPPLPRLTQPEGQGRRLPATPFPGVSHSPEHATAQGHTGLKGRCAGRTLGDVRCHGPPVGDPLPWAHDGFLPDSPTEPRPLAAGGRGSSGTGGVCRRPVQPASRGKGSHGGCPGWGSPWPCPAPRGCQCTADPGRPHQA